jgi:hypothetical protein
MTVEECEQALGSIGKGAAVGGEIEIGGWAHSTVHTLCEPVNRLWAWNSDRSAVFEDEGLPRKIAESDSRVIAVFLGRIFSVLSRMLEKASESVSAVVGQIVLALIAKIDEGNHHTFFDEFILKHFGIENPTMGNLWRVVPAAAGVT